MVEASEVHNAPQEVGTQEVPAEVINELVEHGGETEVETTGIEDLEALANESSSDAVLSPYVPEENYEHREDPRGDFTGATEDNGEGR